MKTIGWFEMAMRFASKSDKCLFVAAAIGTCCFGGVRPGFAFFFGKMTDGVGSAVSEDQFGALEQSALNMVYIGIFGGVFQFL